MNDNFSLNIDYGTLQSGLGESYVSVNGNNHLLSRLNESFCEDVFYVHTFNEAMTGFLLFGFAMLMYSMTLDLYHKEEKRKALFTNQKMFYQIRNMMRVFSEFLFVVAIGWFVYQRFWGVFKT